MSALSRVRRPALRCVRALRPLLAASSAALCFASVLPASAQGGQGNQYTPGWFMLKRGVPPIPPYTSAMGDYDWTHLDIVRNAGLWDGSTNRYPATGFDPAYGGIDANTPSYNKTGSAGGPGSQWNTVTSSGVSTYNWNWNPPYYPGSANTVDTTDFPQPPLFAFAKVIAAVQGDISAIPASIDGNVNDGWGSIDSFALSAIGNAAASVTTRKILPVTSTPPQITLSPTTFARAQVGSVSAGAGVGISVNEVVAAIELSSPSPFVWAEKLGDGGNQYAYDTTALGQGGGLLQVPLEIFVGRATQSDLDWLVSENHVGWAMQPAIDGWIPYTKEVANGRIQPVTNGDHGHALYQGLPASNSGFGNKTVVLKVDGSDSEAAHIQTFFSATASNSPGSDGVTPNWFNYYSQIYPVPDNSSYDSTVKASQTNPDLSIHIANDAFPNYNLHVFALRTGNNYVQWVGDLKINGIHNFIETCGHELGHRTHTQKGIETSDPAKDQDGDGLDDSWEVSHHFKYRVSDTTGAYSNMTNDVGKADRECICDIEALGELLAHKALWTQDWSDMGVQWGQLLWRPTQYPITTTQWQFYPIDATGHLSSTPQPDLPSDALTSLVPLGPVWPLP